MTAQIHGEDSIASIAGVVGVEQLDAAYVSTRQSSHSWFRWRG
jgi:hypothetical protein